MKCEAQKAGFAAGGKSCTSRHVKKRSCGARSIALDDLNVAALFNDEKASAVVIRLLDIERIGKAVSHLDQVKCRGRGRWGWRRRGGAPTVATPVEKEDRGATNRKNKGR